MQRSHSAIAEKCLHVSDEAAFDTTGLMTESYRDYGRDDQEIGYRDLNSEPCW